MSAAHKPSVKAPCNRNADKTRFYLHGDERDGQPRTYYCRRCDCFASAEHFEGCAKHGRIGDWAQIELGIDEMRGKSVPAWAALTADPMRTAREIRARRKARYCRPDNARTVWDRKR